MCPAIVIVADDLTGAEPLYFRVNNSQIQTFGRVNIAPDGPDRPV
jgi:hypothetical protein